MIVIYESCGLSINLNREVDAGQRYDGFPVHFIVALIHIVYANILALQGLFWLPYVHITKQAFMCSCPPYILSRPLDTLSPLCHTTLKNNSLSDQVPYSSRLCFYAVCKYC